MSKSIKKYSGVVGIISICLDCNWRCENLKNGRVLAANHAKNHGHRVSVEVATNCIYDGRHLKGNPNG